jgi:hypothetical protein
MTPEPAGSRLDVDWLRIPAGLVFPLGPRRVDPVPPAYTARRT